jgi:ankyrin repeat protein
VKEFGADFNHANTNGYSPWVQAAFRSNVDMMRFLAKELGADVNQWVNIDMMRFMAKELGADVNQWVNHSTSALLLAAANDDLDMIRCLVKELGADVNQAKPSGVTPLMMASANEHQHVVVWLLKNGADPQAEFMNSKTAAEFSKIMGAPAEQTAYLDAKTHCAKPGCGGAGLKKCAGCLKTNFCSPACQVAFWPSHKAECKRSAALSSLSLSSSSSAAS